MKHHHHHRLPRGVATRRPPFFFSPFFPSSSPRNGTTHGGVPPEGKLRHLLAVGGNGRRVRDSLHNTAPSHKSLLLLVRVGGKKREKNKESTKQARARCPPRHGGTRHNDGSASSSLGVCVSPRPVETEEWHRSSHCGRLQQRGMAIPARKPVSERGGGGRGGREGQVVVVAGSKRPVVFFFRHPYTRLYSFKFSCRMVSFTAANTNRMFSVSVAQVK